MRDTKLQDGDLIEVQGFVMLKGLDEGRYRVRMISGPSGVPVYDFRRPGGKKVLARHYASSVDISVKTADDEQINKIVVVSRGSAGDPGPSMGGMRGHPLVGAHISSVTQRDGVPVIALMKPVGRGGKSQKYESIELTPSRDPEGNGPGVIFGMNLRNGAGFYVFGSADDDQAMRGLLIMDVRPMTKEELDAQGWTLSSAYTMRPTVIALSDMSAIFPSMDSEGNAPGVWVVESRNGKELL